GRVRLLLADAGAVRVRCEADGRPLATTALAQEMERGGMRLRTGESWRMAVELAGEQRPQLRLEAVPASARAVMSHYLILGREGVRWSLHLDVVPESGSITATRLRLPEGARLVAVDGLGLGRWRIGDGVLDLSWAAPLSSQATVDLELDLPIAADGIARVPAPVVEGVASTQQVALVEEDDLGLVRRDTDGLGEIEQPFARLPAGVDRAQVRWLWKASRPDWSLALSREPLVGTVGADGLATLVDGLVTVLPDGGQRGSAIWHVVNRSRQQLPLAIAAGCSVWEARVDGRTVRPRRDAAGGLWLPVPPLRPGQATCRVSLIWAAEPASGALLLDPPMLGGLKVMGSVWRITAPDGWSISRSGGSLHEADVVEAAADRAQAVIDEIQRLQSVDGLAEAGLRRLEGQLAVLDSELKDHLASLGARADRLRGAQAASAVRLGKAASTVDAIASNSQRLVEIQQQITQNFSARGSRKRGLRLDDLNRDWGRGAGVARVDVADGPARHLPGAWPWEDALAPATGSGLGAGMPPPGAGGGTGTALSGIALVEPGTAQALVLRGQGDGMRTELRLDPPRGSAWPWLLSAAAAATVLVGAWLCRRRSG
ncbi:MAG: hypothetical protein J0M02_04475, partial [Planctomycetes bacterium]|nr:hypothetical protein [Planctomycetota bacterium]